VPSRHIDMFRYLKLPLKPSAKQGCQMVYFQTKNTNLGKFWRALKWKMLVYVMVIWNILRPFDILYSHLVMLWSFGIFGPVFWYILSRKVWQPCSQGCLRLLVKRNLFSSVNCRLYVPTYKHVYTKSIYNELEI
jgi:hypothetical protein